MPFTPSYDGTDDFLDLYTLYAGKSEVPLQFHLWSAIASMASATANRVWLMKGPKRLAPNLYVALIGPSAIGKGEAIDAMLMLTRDQPRIRYFKGKMTAPALLDLMATPNKPGTARWSHLFLVTPELSFSAGRGEWADALVKQTTEMYTGSPDALQDIARTRPNVKVPGDYCLNWIMGSTKEWLVSCIPADAISGGFFGRIVVVPADYDFDLRYVRPIMATDYTFLLSYLRARLARLSLLTGEFTFDKGAADVETKWYNDRPAPTDPDLAAAWKRQHDLMLKLAMIFSLASGREDLVITSHHVAHAQKLSDRVVSTMTSAVSAATLSVDTRGIVHAANFLRRFGTSKVLHSHLLKYMFNRGFNADQVAGFVSHLIQQEGLKRDTSTPGKTYYIWQNQKKVMPKMVVPDEPLDAPDE